MRQSKTIVAIIVAVVIVGAMAVFAIAMTFSSFNRVDTVEKQTKDITTQIKTVDQKVDVVGQKVEELAKTPASNLEPAVAVLQITQDLQNLQTKAEQNLGIEFSEVQSVLDSMRSVWPQLNKSQREKLMKAFFYTFSGTKVLRGFSSAQTDSVWAIVDELM